MKKPVISFDFDEVLVDSEIVKRLLKELGLKPSVQSGYGYHGYPEPVRQEIFRRFHDPKANADPRILPGAQACVKELAAAGFDLIIVTARPLDVEAVTVAVVREFFPEVGAVFFTGGGLKGATIKAGNAMLHIDDHNGHLEDAALHGVKNLVLISNAATTWNHDAARGYQESGSRPVLPSVVGLPELVKKNGW